MHYLGKIRKFWQHFWTYTLHPRVLRHFLFRLHRVNRHIANAAFISRFIAENFLVILKENLNRESTIVGSNPVDALVSAVCESNFVRVSAGIQRIGFTPWL